MRNSCIIPKLKNKTKSITNQQNRYNRRTNILIYKQTEQETSSLTYIQQEQKTVINLVKQQIHQKQRFSNQNLSSKT